MAEVNVTIDGKTYGIACDDGQERRLQQLGSYVDQRLRQVGAGAGGSKAQAMVLASLVLADEVYDLNEKLHKAVEEAKTIRAETVAVTQSPRIDYQGLAPQEEQNIINVIGQLAAKVEKLTARVQKKSA